MCANASGGGYQKWERVSRRQSRAFDLASSDSRVGMCPKKGRCERIVSSLHSARHVFVILRHLEALRFLSFPKLCGYLDAILKRRTVTVLYSLI